jgi:ABC-type Fe3+ transport system permease subunit
MHRALRDLSTFVLLVAGVVVGLMVAIPLLVPSASDPTLQGWLAAAVVVGAAYAVRCYAVMQVELDELMYAKIAKDPASFSDAVERRRHR